MRVVQVVRSAMYGGVENHVYELCRNFKAHGIEVILISLVNCEPNEAFRNLGIRIIRLNDTMGWSWRIMEVVFELRRELRRLRPDVVHLHGIRPIFAGGLAASCDMFTPGRPRVISSLHGSYSLMAVMDDGRKNPLLLLAAKIFHWLGFNLSDRVVVNCRALTEEVRNVYRGVTLDIDGVLARKVRVVYNAIDPRPFEHLERQRDIRGSIGVPDNAVVVGTISRLDEPKKGLGVLLRAAREVVNQCAQAYFVICGDGYARGQLQALAEELGIGDRVHFLGYWENVLEVYRLLDVFVLPSLSEGFPTVNLEAMAAGLAVVTTDVGGAAEAVLDGKTGIVVPPGNVPELGDAILRLAEDASLRHSIGHRAKTFVNQMFNVDGLAHGIIGVYEEVGLMGA